MSAEPKHTIEWWHEWDMVVGTITCHAAERTVREQREALERIASDKCVVAKVSWSGTVTCEEMWEGDPDARCPVCIARTALAALAPNPDREGR